MIKRFLEWIVLKIKLHNSEHKPPFVSVGDIWWASLGDNIGQEINGKGVDFTRPVYIFKKLSHNFYLIIPMTSKIKIGSWYIQITQKNREVTACLNQIRTIDHRRLLVKLSESNLEMQQKIKEGFINLYIN